jgi:hypothetical protein
MKRLITILLFCLCSQAHAQVAIDQDSTDQHVTLRLLDSAGAYVTAQDQDDVDCFYRRQGAAAAVAITEAAGTLGTHADGGFAEDTDLEHYELGVPDAAFASGANWVVVGCTDASGTDFVAVVKDILLTDPEPSVSCSGGSSGNGTASAVQ